MTVSEIESLIRICNFEEKMQTEKAEILDMVGNVTRLCNCSKRFNKARFDYDIENGKDYMESYAKLVKCSLEGGLAELGVFLFSLANKYHMNMQSLELKKNTPSQDFVDMVFSMVKISMSHHRICKKIIVLIGILCNYCIEEDIDLPFFVRNKLVMNIV